MLGTLAALGLFDMPPAPSFLVLGDERMMKHLGIASCRSYAQTDTMERTPCA